MAKLTLFSFVLLFIFQVLGTLHYNIESSSLCSEITRRKIKLGKTEDSALVVSHKGLSNHPIDWDRNKNCEFRVTSKKKDGIVAVIQNLNFRKNFTTNECIDYLQFEIVNNLVKSSKFCGEIDAREDMDKALDTKSASSYNSFTDPDGDMLVRVFIDKRAVGFEENVDLNVVFTTYRRQCLYSNSDVPCGVFQSTCIYNKLINDSVVNCPFYGCVDEPACKEKETVNESVGNKVLIASVSTIAILFFVFTCCLWICKMHKILCWAEEFSGSGTSTIPEQNTRLELDESAPSRRSSQIEPTAPPVQTQEDKDLPPSYDSLFPARVFISDYSPEGYKTKQKFVLAQCTINDTNYEYYY